MELIRHLVADGEGNVQVNGMQEEPLDDRPNFGNEFIQIGDIGGLAAVWMPLFEARFDGAEPNVDQRWAREAAREARRHAEWERMVAIEEQRWNGIVEEHARWWDQWQQVQMPFDAGFVLPDRPDFIVGNAKVEGVIVTEEMVREAQTLREKDEGDPSFSRYSRECAVCAIANPRQRAVFTGCGHIVCYSCAVDNAKSDATNGKCVFCRTTSGFVKLFEDECAN